MARAEDSISDFEPKPTTPGRAAPSIASMGALRLRAGVAGCATRSGDRRAVLVELPRRRAPTPASSHAGELDGRAAGWRYRLHSMRSAAAAAILSRAVSPIALTRARRRCVTHRASARSSHPADGATSGRFRIRANRLASIEPIDQVVRVGRRGLHARETTAGREPNRPPVKIGATSVTAGERGYQDHRDRRSPGTHPVAWGRFFACAH